MPGSLQGLSIYVNSHPAPATQELASASRLTAPAAQAAGASTCRRVGHDVEKQVGIKVAKMADMVARFARVATPDHPDYVDATSHPIDFDYSLESLDEEEEEAQEEAHGQREQGARRRGPKFVVWPIDASLRLKLSKSGARREDEAKYDATLLMSVVNLRLEKGQYRHVIRTLDLFNNFERLARYGELRPKDGVRQDPRAWWRYAFNCLVWERQLRLGRFDKARLLRHLVEWTEYARLYRTKMLLGAASAAPPAHKEREDERREREVRQGRLAALEDTLPLPAISLARQCVARQIKREARAAGSLQTASAPRDAAAKLSSSASSAPARRGWFSGWTWGSRSSGTDTVTVEAAGERAVADKRLLHAQLMREMGVADDEEEGGADDDAHDKAEGDELNLQLAFLLQGGSLTLLTGGLLEAGRGDGTHAHELSRPLTTITYEGLKLEMTSRAGSMTVQAQLGSCTVLDRWTDNIGNAFETIMTRAAAAACRTPAMSPPRQGRPAGADAGAHRSPQAHHMPLAAVSSALPSLPRFPAIANLTNLGHRGLPAAPPDMGERGGERGEEGPLLCFKYVTNPAERHGVKADSLVQLLLDRLTFVYNPGWLSVLLDFTNVGESAGTVCRPRVTCDVLFHGGVASWARLHLACACHLRRAVPSCVLPRACLVRASVLTRGVRNGGWGGRAALEHLKRSAAETFEAAKKASEENLKSALTQKVMMDLHLDLRAPVILIPENVARAPDTDTEQGSADAVMVVQPGNLSVWSLKAQHLSQVSRLLCGIPCVPYVRCLMPDALCGTLPCLLLGC